MPSFVGKYANDYVNETSQVVSYSPTLGNLVLLFLTVNGNGTTAAIFDNAGNDIFNNPLNSWTLLGNVTMDQTGLRQELWCCPNVLAAFTDINVVFSEQNSSFNAAVLEYSSGVVGGVGATQDSGNSNLFFVGTAQNNSAVMVVGFNCQQVAPYVAAGIYAPSGKSLGTITPGVERATADGGGGNNFLEVQEQTVISDDSLIVEAGTTQVVNGITAVGVVLTGGISLSTPPGFSAVDETKLVAGAIAHSIVLDQISQNGEFGMVRPEFFYTIQTNGDTVPLPVSPVDGYNYVADECYYMWTPLTTFDASTGWVSQSGILFYCQWSVDQDTGAVTCQEYYHPDGNTPVTSSTDGQLLVLTIAQRARGALGLTVPPGLAELPFASIVEDAPLTQSLMQTLAINSKFAAVKAEVIYMGEFVNGQTVPQPISPEDQYVYSYAEVMFMSCWKWTTEPNAFAPPPMATANGGNADGGWSQLNELQASVGGTGLVNCQVFFNNHGVIDPSAADNGGIAYGRLVVFAFCQRVKGPSFGIPTLSNPIGYQSSPESNIVKITNPRSISGNLSVGLLSGSSSMNVSKLVIKKCATGSTTVLTTSTFTFSGSDSVAITGYLQSDQLSYSFEEGYDYYLILVYSGGFSYSLLEGVANLNTPPIGYVSGDQSGVTTIPAFSFSITWGGIASIIMSIVDPVLADEFVEVPFDNFAPGQPLLASAVEQIARNVQEGCYAVEFFGPTNHVNGDTVALPTSPADGYEYTRAELFYIWNWHDTGTAGTRLFGFGASISEAGVVTTNVWHVPSGSPPTDYGQGGSEPADGSIDVLVIAVRSGLNPQGGSGGVTNGSNPPTDLTSLTFGGAGGYTINGGS